MILVTGGAGFIGSNLLAALEERGDHDLVLCDRFGIGEKWRNVVKRDLAHVVEPDDLLGFLEDNRRQIDAIFHLGAITSTTEGNVDALLRTNFNLSLGLWQFCAGTSIRFIYASSAATYGDGKNGFEDEFSAEALSRLQPLNAYGWSKHLFDRRIATMLAQPDAEKPKQWAGLKFFNVYGPNEYHKGAMKSVAAHLYPKLMAGEPARLFKSNHADFADGEQKRDFVWVGDCVDVMLWLYDHPDISGLFNVGSGQARSYNDLARAMFTAAGKPARIEYIDMPDSLRARYQNFTEARMERLRQAGYTTPFTSLEDGVTAYITNYLAKPDPYV